MGSERKDRRDRARTAPSLVDRAPGSGPGARWRRAGPLVAAALCAAVLAGGFPRRAEAVAPLAFPAESVAGQDSGVATCPVLTMVAFPNPFHAAVRLTIEGPGHGATSLRVYDPRGSLVCQLIADDGVSRPRSLMWDGRDQAGAALVSGTYYAVLSVGDDWRVQPLMMVK